MSSEPRPSEERPSGPSPLDRAADQALAVLRHAPALALLATCAALFELMLGRVGWHGLTELAGPETVRVMGRWARLPRNLAAVAGLVTLVFGLLHYLRFPGLASIGRRLAVAAVAGIFVPSILVATFLPHASLRPGLVLFGLFASNVLVTLLGLSALGYRGPAAVRVAIIALTITTTFSLLVLGIARLAEIQGGPWGWLAAMVQRNPTTTQVVNLGLRHLGELAWHAVPLAIAWTTIVGEPAERTKARVGTGLALAVVVVAAVLALATSVGGHRFPLVMFGSFGWMLLVDQIPAVYAISIGAAIAGGIVGLSRSRPEAQQLSMGGLLWLCAGYAPHTPVRLLYLVLAGVLLVRAAQAFDPHGRWRQRHPWLRLAGRK